MVPPLANAPIIEAVVDIDCDLPPDLDFQQVEKTATQRFQAQYPIFRKSFIHGHSMEQSSAQELVLNIQQGLNALQFRTEDKKQLIQFRTLGFSFNRLAPYGSLDDYLPEIQARWRDFRDIMRPIKLKKVGLRYINRIVMPRENEGVELDHFLKVSPQLPNCKDQGFDLNLGGFIQQFWTVDPATRLRANISLATEALQPQGLPIILDIDTFSPEDAIIPEWENLYTKILTLRRLKNSIFRNLLTDKCLTLFSHQPS